MPEQIKATLQEADFYPEGMEVELDYYTATFRVPKDTTLYPGEYIITFPAATDDNLPGPLSRAALGK